MRGDLLVLVVCAGCAGPSDEWKRQTRDRQVKVWTIVGAKGDSRQARLSEEMNKPCREEEVRVHVRRDFGLLFQGRSSLQRRLTWGVRES